MGSKRLGHWIAMMGMDKAWVGAERNKSEGLEEGHCRLDNAVH